MYSKNRWVLTLLVLCFAFVSFTPLTAQELILSKVYMKDGNVFIGEITRYESGIITIKTEYGTFNLDDSKVKYITVSESELKESYKEPCIVLKDGKVIPGKISSYISVLKRVKVTSNYGDIIIDRFKDIALIILEPVEVKPWLSGWAYRKKITISGSTGAGTNYQVLLKVGESSGATGADFNLGGLSAKFPSGKNDGGDLRFTAADGVTLQDFWVESVTGNSPNRVAYVWVEVSADLGSNQSIYCYYGNPNATNVSNGDNTFLFFDDFDDGVVNTSKWNVGAATYNKYVWENSGLFAANTDLLADENSVSDYYRVYGTKTVDTVTEDGLYSGWIGKGIRSVPTFNLANGLAIETELYLYSYGQGTAPYRGILVGLSTIYDKDNRVDFSWLWDASANQRGNGLAYAKEEAGTRTCGVLTAGTLNAGTTYRFTYKKDTSNNFSANFGGITGSITSTFNSSVARVGLFGVARGIGDSLDVRWNWILVRKYTFPEPAVYSAGSEEKRN